MQGITICSTVIMWRASKMFAAFLLFFVLATVNAECPNILTKKQWGGRQNKEVDYMIVPIKYAIIEHTVSQECNSILDCSRKIGNLQNYHMNNLDYHDIGYNFIIGGDGNVYEGTGWNQQGAHTYKWNSKALGIAFMGDFSEKLPPKVSLDAAKKLLECGVELGQLDSRYKLLGHRQVISTESPGLRLYQEIINWPNHSDSTD